MATCTRLPFLLLDKKLFLYYSLDFVTGTEIAILHNTKEITCLLLAR